MDTKVFITLSDAHCSECGEDLSRGAWIFLGENRAAYCLACADLDHLAFLPPGNAALTRRAGKYSTLSAVGLKWSRARNRYERQGLLVEHKVLEQAEQECLADSDARERRRVRLAMIAHIRHWETRYDHLLAQGLEREDAPREIHASVEAVLHQWEAGE